MTDSDNTFGQWLKQQRKVLDLTQEDLAIRTGVSWETLRKMESGTRRPSKAVAEALADVFRIPREERPAFVQFARSGVGVEHFLSLPEEERRDG